MIAGQRAALSWLPITPDNVRRKPACFPSGRAYVACTNSRTGSTQRQTVTRKKVAGIEVPPFLLWF